MDKKQKVAVIDSADRTNEIELQDTKAHTFKKVKSFNVGGKDQVYSKFEQHHDEEHHNFTSAEGHQNFYMIDPEALKTGQIVITHKDTTANPAPLGLLGFGLTTFLLNMHNAGVFPLNSMVLAMGLCYGGAAQILAGIFEWKKNNMFGMIAFMSYGFFWWSFSFLVIIPKMGYGIASNPESLAWYLFIWGIFTTCMFVATLKRSPWALCFVFFTVIVLFMLLAAHNWTESPALLKAAGIEGIICGLSAIYVAFGEILNATYGRTLIPLGIRNVK